MNLLRFFLFLLIYRRNIDFFPRSTAQKSQALRKEVVEFNFRLELFVCFYFCSCYVNTIGQESLDTGKKVAEGNGSMGLELGRRQSNSGSDLETLGGARAEALRDQVVAAAAGGGTGPGRWMWGLPGQDEEGGVRGCQCMAGWGRTRRVTGAGWAGGHRFRRRPRCRLRGHTGRGGGGGLGGRGEGRALEDEDRSSSFCKVVWKEQRSWRVADSGLRHSLGGGCGAAGVGADRGLLKVGQPGTIRKTSASFARAVPPHLKLGRDGVS